MPDINDKVFQVNKAVSLSYNLEKYGDYLKDIFNNQISTYRTGRDLADRGFVIIKDYNTLVGIFSKDLPIAYRGRSATANNNHAEANACGFFHFSHFNADRRKALEGFIEHKQVAVPKILIRLLINRGMLLGSEYSEDFDRDTDRKVGMEDLAQTLTYDERLVEIEGVKKCPIEFWQRYGVSSKDFLDNDISRHGGWDIYGRDTGRFSSKAPNFNNIFPSSGSGVDDALAYAMVGAACLLEHGEKKVKHEYMTVDDLEDDSYTSREMVAKLQKAWYETNLTNNEGDLNMQDTPTQTIEGLDVQAFFTKTDVQLNAEFAKVLDFMGLDWQALTVEQAIELNIQKGGQADFSQILINDTPVVTSYLRVNYDSVSVNIVSILTSEKDSSKLWRETNRNKFAVQDVLKTKVKKS